MGDIGKIYAWAFKIGNYEIVVNYMTIIWTWIVMAILIILAYLAGKGAKLVPVSRITLFFDWLIDGFRGIVFDTLGEELGRKYFGFIMTIFLFVMTSNVIGIIPGSVCPTQDLNTTLGLGLLVFFVVHGSAIYYKGLWGYLKSYAEPFLLLLPLNVVGEIAKVISHSFRLFGNILGGSIIIIVVGYLVKEWVLPIILNGFFGVFVGIVQAFVFAMLALVYLAVAIVED